MNGWERALRAAGGRLTSQRRVVVSILQEQSCHLSADEIFLLARQQNSRLSLATVYRTLQWLKDLGLVCELRLNGNQCRYVIERGQEDQYMVCLGCGEVMRFTCAHTSAVHNDLADQHDFQVTETQVKLLGYCADCRAHTSSRKGIALGVCAQTCPGRPLASVW
jgi:Fur family ferric uptake transcriptional regulator